MAPYNPPDAHYSEIDVSHIDHDTLMRVVGPGGRGFYKLTSQLGLKYIWYDYNRKVIELWGSYLSLKNGAKDAIQNVLINAERCSSVL